MYCGIYCVIYCYIDTSGCNNAYARRFLAGSFKFWEYLQQETTKCGFFLTDV